MRSSICAILLAALLSGLGCAESKKSEPKLADPSKIDPRIKESGTGTGGAPQQGKAQGAIKGE